LRGTLANANDLELRFTLEHYAQRAVERANGENRVAIVIPCHRMVRGDGTLCGYGGGLSRKQHSLDPEQAGAEGEARGVSARVC